MDILETEPIGESNSSEGIVQTPEDMVVESDQNMDNETFEIEQEIEVHEDLEQRKLAEEEWATIEQTQGNTFFITAF